MMTMRTARMGALLLLAPTVQAVMNAGGVPCKLHPTSQEGGGAAGGAPRAVLNTEQTDARRAYAPRRTPHSPARSGS